MHKIQITAGNVILDAELVESPTTEKIIAALPIETQTNTWGDELYFDIGVAAGPEPDARADVEVGELGYWPPGNAFCIFFGRTPASSDDRPKAASPVNIIGKVSGDAGLLKSVRDGDNVRIEKAE